MRVGQNHIWSHPMISQHPKSKDQSGLKRPTCPLWGHNAHPRPFQEVRGSPQQQLRWGKKTASLKTNAGRARIQPDRLKVAARRRNWTKELQNGCDNNGTEVAVIGFARLRRFGQAPSHAGKRSRCASDARDKRKQTFTESVWLLQSDAFLTGLVPCTHRAPSSESSPRG